MTGLESFILGLFVNGSYDILKKLFQGSYEILEKQYSSGNQDVFINELKKLLESNEKLRFEVEKLKNSEAPNGNTYNFDSNSNPRGNFGNNGTYNE